MKASVIALVIAGAVVIAATAIAAADLKDKVKIAVSNVGLHPGLEPGLYACAQNHLHIKGTVQNTGTVPVGRIKVGAQAFDASGKLLGTATSTTKQARLAPGETAEINVEFLTVTGDLIEQVKRHQLAVLEAPALQ